MGSRPPKKCRKSGLFAKNLLPTGVFITSRINACANAGDTGCRVPRRKGLPTNACMDARRMGLPI
jgi:hypothetical protein